MNTLLKTKLREHALILRDLSASLRADPAISADAALRALRSKKEALLKEVYVVMSATLGVPPRPDEKQTWDYYDKDGKPGSWTGTPREFYKAFAYDKYSVSCIRWWEMDRELTACVAGRLVLADQRPA